MVRCNLWRPQTPLDRWLLLCLEVYEKSFEHEIRMKEFPISQICYTKFPKYEKLYEIDKSIQIPVVNASDMKLFRGILKAILDDEKTGQTRGKSGES